MFNFISYILFNLSNLFFLILIPDYFTKFFLVNYSISSGIFIFFVFYYFSKKEFFSERTLFIINTFLIFISEFFNNDNYTIILFAYLLIYSDYFFSQKKNYIINFFLKLLLLFTSFLLYESFLHPILVLKLKIILIYSVFLVYFFLCKKFPTSSLNVNSPLMYTFLTCVIYYSSLLLLAIIITDNYIKLVYLSFQILIGIQLKFYDLRIRKINFNILLEYFFWLISFLYLIFIISYTKLYFLIPYHLIIVLSLNLIKKKYIIATK